jgi:OPT oligopeptide transporter protein
VRVRRELLSLYPLVPKLIEIYRYNALLWFFPIGFFLPIPFYFLARRFPLSFWRFVNIPIFFAGLGAMPPASGINYISWALVGFIFNFLVRRFHFRWWMRYNYILSAALDSGVAIASIVVFFALQFPKDGIYVNWWGNEYVQIPLFCITPRIDQASGYG